MGRFSSQENQFFDLLKYLREVGSHFSAPLILWVLATFGAFVELRPIPPKTDFIVEDTHDRIWLEIASLSLVYRKTHNLRSTLTFSIVYDYLLKLGTLWRNKNGGRARIRTWDPYIRRRV